MPLADVEVGQGEVLADGEDGRLAFEAAIDDWLCLTAAALVGLGARRPRDRRRVREGAAGLRGADRLVPGDLAPARRLGHGRSTVPGCSPTRPPGRPTTTPTRAPELAALAFAFAARDGSGRLVPEPALPRRLRLHDGVRHPAALAPGPGLERRLGRAGCRLPAGRRRPTREAMMDFRLGADAEALRAELRDFLDAALDRRARGAAVPLRGQPRRGLRPGPDRPRLVRAELVRGARRAGARPDLGHGHLGGDEQGRRPDLRHRGLADDRQDAGQASAPTRCAATSCPACCGARRSACSASPSPRPAPTWPTPRPGRCVTATSGSSTGRRCSRPTPRSATTSTC